MLGVPRLSFRRGGRGGPVRAGADGGDCPSGGRRGRNNGHPFAGRCPEATFTTLLSNEGGDKAKTAPDDADARHLAWLRDRMGDEFIAGAVLHTGPGSYKIEDRIRAVPISAMWS